MAARKARFYVYALTQCGDVAYVGKGSGHRLRVSMNNHRLPGHEVARFFKERDAYAFEKQLIAEVKPWRNKAAGGNGSRATPVRVWTGKTKWEKAIEAVGTRKYVARFLDLNWE